MKFKLIEFAQDMLKDYIVEIKGKYNRHTEELEITTKTIKALIYKKNLSYLVPNVKDGGRIGHVIKGYAYISDNIQNNNTIIFQDKKYKVTNLMNREYADFTEFELELVENE